MDIKNRVCLVLTLLLCLPSLFLTAQSRAIKGTEVQDFSELKIDAQLLEYSVYEVNSEELVQFVRNDDAVHRVALDLPGVGVFDLDLVDHDILSDNYVTTVISETGKKIIPRSNVVKTFRGTVKGGKNVVSLTIDHNFIYGFIQTSAKDEIRIEPLHLYLPDAAEDQYIVFKASDAVKQQTGCLALEHPGADHDHGVEETQNEGQQKLVDDCREVQIAFANDWLMRQSYGSITNVENHNMGVMNDVQNNYDTEFSDDLTFIIVEIWVSNCSTCDPWTNSTNSGALLDDFTDWGPSGFSNTHDVAGLWSDRDFNGSTIGVSWVDAVCTLFRYLVLQDFTNNGNLLRCLLAHELGHNFGSNHDPEGSGTIMAPSVSNTNTWSASSISQINSYLNQINCLSLCQSLQAPVAAFDSDNSEGCSPFTVHFTDESTGPPTNWQWTFPGGSPASSSQQNPTVTYNTPGEYDVILMVSNSAGSNTLVSENYITVLPEPTADFIYDQFDLVVNFTSLAENADTWDWDFGDGGSSSQQNPSHSYAQDGVYEVVLTVSNDCGEDEFTVFIEVVTPPEAGFSYSTDFGCAPLVVQFINESSDNAEDFEWFFPGGSPSSSTQENPVVTYNNPGLFSVTLIVENSAGVDEFTINNLIEVDPQPDADFSFAVNGLNVQFVNASLDANNYLWIFGDGETSTSTSPNHAYDAGGIYQVMLIASNSCGPDTAFATVQLNAAPIADFTVMNASGCAPLIVTFTSTSQGDITSYNWSFPGGNPSTSTSAMPVVTYNSVGTYSAQLIVGNAIGFDTLFLPNAVQVLTDVNSDFLAEVNGTVGMFTNNSFGASSFTWIVDGNTFTTTDLDYTFGADGDYVVTLIASGNCGNDTSTQVVHIVTPPEAGFGSDGSAGCQPFVVEFTNLSSENATTFEWIFEGGTPSTSTEENPVVVYQDPGTYDVQLTVWSEGGMDVVLITDMITVSPQPVSSFTTDQTLFTVSFTNTSQFADSYFWIFGDGETSTETDPVHVYGDFGTYVVMLITENSCGQDTLTYTLEVSSAPVPMFSATGTQGCVPLVVQYTDMSQNGPELWEWSFPGGSPDTSNLQNPVVTYNTPGIYSVTLRVSNGGGAQAIVRDEYIYVAVPPVADFVANVDGGVVSFENESQGGDEYFWTFGDGAMDTTTNPVHVYNTSGTYPVQLITWNVCGSDTMIVNVQVTVTGTYDVSNTFGIEVFPNPHSGQFSVEYDGNEAFELEVYDILGRKVMTKTLGGGGREELHLDDPKPGVYTALFRKEDYTYLVKMLVVDPR